MAVIAPCGAMQALANLQYEIISSLNKKLLALRRLAELLEQLGDLSALLPDISQLIPVVDVNLELYADLQVNCPWLNLPPADTAALAALQSKLNLAYATLARKVANLPWLRMNQMQVLLNDFQNKINYPYGDDYLRCLQAICNAAGQAGSLLSPISQADISRELRAFGTNFVDNAGQVLTAPMAFKRDQAIDVFNGVLDLRDDSVRDFQSLTTQGEAGPVLTRINATEPNFRYQADGVVILLR